MIKVCYAQDRMALKFTNVDPVQTSDVSEKFGSWIFLTSKNTDCKDFHTVWMLNDCMSTKCNHIAFTWIEPL